jgi:hypothetical protein
MTTLNGAATGCNFPNNPSYIATSDGNFADINITTSGGGLFYASGYTIPSGAIITNLAWQLSAKCMTVPSAPSPFISTLFINTSVNYALTTTAQTFSGSTSTGLPSASTWNANTTAGFVINVDATSGSADLGVDYITFTVTYTIPGSNLFFGSAI